jgi:hypothetical protein
LAPGLREFARTKQSQIVNAMVDRIRKAIGPFDGAAKELSVALQSAGSLSPDACGLANILRATREQVANSIAVSIGPLTACAEAILEPGTPFRRTGISVAAPTSPSKPVPPTKLIYLLENVCWVTEAGVTETAARFSRRALPIPLAERAMKTGCARDPNDPVAQRLAAAHGAVGYLTCAVDDAIDLDRIDNETDVTQVGVAAVLERQGKRKRSSGSVHSLWNEYNAERLMAS